MSATSIKKIAAHMKKHPRKKVIGKPAFVGWPVFVERVTKRQSLLDRKKTPRVSAAKRLAALRKRLLDERISWT